jgi:hypothetical protein
VDRSTERSGISGCRTMGHEDGRIRDRRRQSMGHGPENERLKGQRILHKRTVRLRDTTKEHMLDKRMKEYTEY